MRICKFEDLRKYQKPRQKKTEYQISNFFVYIKNEKITSSWSNEAFGRIGLCDFFLSKYSFKPLGNNPCYPGYRKFFEYDSQTFEQEKGNSLNSPEILNHLVQNIYFFPEKLNVRPDLMDFQPDINGKMRAILVDWLIDVHNKFKLTPKTLHLTVSILDRFLSQKSLVRQKLQLLGITSMLLASKYEEIYAPETQDFVYISDKSYTKEDIFKMETFICTSLRYRFSQLSSLIFLFCWLKFFNLNEEKIIFSIYCIDLTLLDLSILKFSQKTVAAAVTIVINEVFNSFLDQKNKNEMVKFYQRFSIDPGYLEECSNTLKSFLVLNQNGKRRLTALKRKYLSKKYKEISAARFSVIF